jgi:Fe-S-cluster containining protein
MHQKFESATELYNHLSSFYSLLDTQINDYIRREELTIACRKGCGICCHIKVDVNAHEILYLAHHIETALPNYIRAVVLSDLRKSATAIAPLSARDHFLGRFKCAFLQDGSCTVHPARPSMCRKFNSLSLEGCKQMFRAGGKAPLQGPEDHGLDEFAATMIKTFDLHFNASGYDGSIYEINQSVLMTLEKQNCVERWLAGKKVLPRRVEAKKFSAATQQRIMERRAQLHNQLKCKL